MMIRRAIQDEIRAGRVRLAFRRWKRPTVRAGGTLTTAVGVLRIDAVEEVLAGDVTEAEAVAAGVSDRASLMSGLNRPGTLYRIALRWEDEDPRAALAMTTPASDEAAGICERLAAVDARTPDGAWTIVTLRLISAHPRVRAADLAMKTGQPRDRFKTRVRRLKALGLTESCATGYRLSARGHVVLTTMETASQSKNGQD